MKRLVTMLLAMVSIGVSAQKEPSDKREMGMKADMTAEQLAILHTKKLTLALDLTEAQRQKVMELSLEQAQMRKAKQQARRVKKGSGEWKKPTPEERFELENARLDHEIVQHKKMRALLDNDQYQTWKKLKLRRAMNGKKRMKERMCRG